MMGPSEVKRKFELIDSSAQMLLYQINQNLDKSLIDSNFFRPDVQQHTVNEVFVPILKLCNDQAKLRDITIEPQSDIERNLLIFIDKNRI